MSAVSDVYKFISENSGVNRADILAAFPDTGASALVSAYERMYQAGKINRIASSQGYLYYTGDSAPQIESSKLAELEKTAIRLEEKGFYRRAATVWLQAYDCSQRHTDRERYAKRRRYCLSGMTSGTRDGSAAPVACYAEVPL